MRNETQKLSAPGLTIKKDLPTKISFPLEKRELRTFLDFSAWFVRCQKIIFYEPFQLPAEINWITTCLV